MSHIALPICIVVCHVLEIHYQVTKMALVWMHCTLPSNDSELVADKGKQAVNGQMFYMWKQGKNNQTQQINVKGKVQNTKNHTEKFERETAISLNRTRVLRQATRRTRRRSLQQANLSDVKLLPSCTKDEMKISLFDKTQNKKNTFLFHFSKSWQNVFLPLILLCTSTFFSNKKRSKRMSPPSGFAQKNKKVLWYLSIIYLSFFSFA